MTDDGSPRQEPASNKAGQTRGNMTQAQKIDCVLSLLMNAHVDLSEVALLDEGVGVLAAVRKQRCAVIVEQYLEPAFYEVKALCDLTEAEAVPLFLRQVGEQIDDLERTISALVTLLEGAYGASRGDEVGSIQTAMESLARQIREVIFDERFKARQDGSP